MKLALITPKGVYFSNDERIVGFFRDIAKNATENFLMPQRNLWSGGSLGLLIVAALTPSYITIEYIDENYEEINFDNAYDLVGITAMTQQASRAYEIADQFKRKGARVVIGGIHATVLPQEAKEHADTVVIGEAENTWPELISDFMKGELKPYYRSKVLVDMTKSPVPRYDLLTKYNYKVPWIQTARGCPRDCDFCAASKVFGKKYRHKTIEQVLQEINFVRGLWPEPLLCFADDNIFLHKTYAYELLKRLKQMELRWLAQTDVSIVDDDALLFLLEDSNCKMLFLGFETISKKQKLDKHGWKQRHITQYPKIIEKIQSLGIGVLGSFIIGLDSDDSSIFNNLSDFIIENRLFAAQVLVLTPLPGTRLREQLESEKRILSNDWGKYTFFDVNFIPKKMKVEELQEGLLTIYKKIYAKDVRTAVVKHFLKIYKNRHMRHMSARD
jgi:radical SAM superfamily enzyme YgiQ (UPF0313 family)